MHEKKKTLLLRHQTNCFNMKKLRFILVFISFISVLASCSTDVDMYAEYKDVPIIYAMLNARADTNYIKITRAFCGTNDNLINANEVALIYDSSNYPGKLDVRIIELKNNHGGPYEPTDREFVLDTMTIHNKQEGTFYAPHQIVYYTTEPFNTGAYGSKYKYRLLIVKPDGDTVTAQTSMVGNEEFNIESASANFQMEQTDVMGKILFRADGSASIYDVKIQFNYREQLAGQEMKYKNVSRSFGTKPLDSYVRVEGTENLYYQEYSINWLFNALANAIGGDTIVNPNHPNVVRYYDSFVVSVSAGGDELNYYYIANQAQLSSPIALISTYTNISGGYGLFSSRTTIEKTVRLSSFALRDLFGMESWGFKDQ